MHLQPGETLLLYTDGLTDSLNPDDVEYGIDRLCEFVNLCPVRSGKALVKASAEDWTKFRDGTLPSDDLTIMSVWRAGEPAD
jgi:sigma-B regulation protein RsbU (phosphoserine phosphatase)